MFRIGCILPITHTMALRLKESGKLTRVGGVGGKLSSDTGGTDKLRGSIGAGIAVSCGDS